MRYLVTGANGYIGSHIVKKLLDAGQEVFAADVNFASVDERAVRVEGDIFSGDADVFEKLHSPDVCIHLAWRDGFVHNADSHILDLPKHYVFLKHMIAGGLKHLVVMGSMHEIGYWEGAIDEHTPANPQSLYGIAKNSLRQIATELAKNNGVCLQWIRGFYILGDDLKNHSVFCKILQAEMEGKKKLPITTGKNLYDFIKVDELAEQIVAVASQTEVDGVINCCSGKPVSLAEKMEEFIEEHHLKIRLDYGAFPDREYGSPAIWGNPDKNQKIMGE